MDAGQSKILAKLESRTKSSYDKVKETEASAGGRTLPGGLVGGVSQATNAKLGEGSNGNPYFFIYSSVQEPEDCKGIFNGFIYTLVADRYNSEDENHEKLVCDLKLLGYEELVDNANSIGELCVAAIEAIQRDQPCFTFNTAKRANKQGEYRSFIQGVAEDYESTEPEETPEGTEEVATDPVPDEPAEIQVDDIVNVDESVYGEVYEGQVKKIVKSRKVALVYFPSDESEDEIALDCLTLAAGPNEVSEPQAEAIEEGDAVTTINDYFGDGVDYTGVVNSVNGTEASIEFDDGSGEQEIPLSSLSLL